MQKTRNAIMAILAVVLVAAFTVGGTLAYMTDSAELINAFRVGDLDMTFKEPDWPIFPPGQCPDRVPGDSFPKNPTVKIARGSAYIRIKIEFLIGTSGSTAITDPAKVAKILETIYYDQNFSNTVIDGYKGSAKLKLWVPSLAEPHTPNADFHYTKSMLDALVADPTSGIQRWYNQDDFDLETVAGQPGVFYLNYKGILDEGMPGVAAFTSIVFPSNWNQQDIKAVGDFQIKLTAYAIQSEGFEDRAEAFEMLAEELAGNDGRTFQHNYGL